MRESYIIVLKEMWNLLQRIVSYFMVCNMFTLRDEKSLSRQSETMKTIFCIRSIHCNYSVYHSSDDLFSLSTHIFQNKRTLCYWKTNLMYFMKQVTFFVHNDYSMFNLLYASIYSNWKCMCVVLFTVACRVQTFVTTKFTAY